jgi:hypothetical protein
MNAPATASSWLCDRCGMTASLQSGEQTSLPKGWISSEEGDFCLVCRRERAAEAALESAPDASSHKVRADLRRDAILGFEVTRDPERPNAAIAQACRSSVSAVASIRRRLGVPDADAAVPRPRARRSA